MVSELSIIQKAVGQVLLPSIRDQQNFTITEDQALPLALEFYYTAFAMKASYRQAAIYMADAFARRLGLVPDDVYAFAQSKLNFVVNRGK